MKEKAGRSSGQSGFRKIPVQHLRDFVQRAGASAGIAGRDLDLFVNGVIESDLRGIDTHGIMRVPPYVRGFLAGELNSKPQVRVVRERGAIAVLDGDNGLGGIVGHAAMDRAIELAAIHGIGMVSMRNSNHSGMLAQFVQRAIAKDMIGYFVSNGPAAMAPWGGLEQMLSNNPFAWGIPASARFPIILDMACSAAARGKIRLAAMKKEKIPFGWALDPEGNPTDDPNAAMTGFILPAGGYKGSGIAIVNEVIAAILPGAVLSMDASRRFLEQGATMFDSWRIGHTAIAIDISAFEDVAEFKAKIDRFVDRLQASRRAKGCDTILMPGEPEELFRQTRLREGIPIADGVIAATTLLARDIGIEPIQ